MSKTGKSDAVGETLEDLDSGGDAIWPVGEKAVQAGSSAFGQSKSVARDAKAQAGFVASAIGEKASWVAPIQKSHRHVASLGADSTGQST